jgi:hypothetical protein
LDKHAKHSQVFRIGYFSGFLANILDSGIMVALLNLSRITFEHLERLVPDIHDFFSPLWDIFVAPFFCFLKCCIIMLLEITFLSQGKIRLLKIFFEIRVVFNGNFGLKIRGWKLKKMSHVRGVSKETK